MPELDRIDELILFFVERLSGQITRTRLVKFIYLADYEARRWLGRPISSLMYFFEHYGPYDKGFPEHIDHVRGLIEEEPRRWVDYTGYVYHFKGPHRPHAFDREETIILNHIVTKYAHLPLPELLDEVVYQTEPMREAKASERRYAELNMDSVNGAARRKFGADLKDLLLAKDQLDAGRWKELT